MNLIDVSTDQLRRALGIREEIESLKGQLDSLLSGRIQSRKSAIGNGVRRRRTMSASARARIAAAQRARWAKVKGSATSSSGLGRRKRRKMSAAGRAAIAAAARARWARYNAARKG